MKPKFRNPSAAMCVLSLCALSLLGAHQAHAATITWTGSGNGSGARWDRTGNWSPSSSPEGQDLLFSGAAVTSTMNASYAVNSITFGSGAGAFTLTNSNGAVLTLGGGGIVNNDDSLQTISFGSIIGLSASQSWSANTGALTVTSAIDNNGNLLTVNAAFQTILSGLISDSGGLTKTGSGTLLLGGIASNTYSGTTSVSAGTLSYAGNNALGTGAVSIDGSTAILNLATFNDSVGTVTVANGGSITGTTGVLTSTGTFEMQNGSVSAKLAGAGALNKTTGGTVTLSGENTYTGQTQVSGGTLQLGSGGTTGSLTGTSSITNNGSLVVNRSNAFTQATDLNNKAITGSGSFTQAGAGTTTLSLANSYTGATNVNAGTLIIDGSTHASSAVSVGALGILGGTGTINGTLAVTGILSPGTGLGDKTTLDAGATTWNGGSVWNFDLAAASGTSDKLVINGAFTKGTAGAYQFNFMSSAPAAWGNSYDLVTFTSTDFTASNFSFTGLTGSYTNGTFSFTGVGNNTLTFTAIPEPTSALAGLLLGAGLLRRRRI